jgi:hypothetical protein
MVKCKVILKTSHKNSHRVRNCLDTWLNGLDYVCLTDKITREFEEFSGSDNDTYNSNEEKTVNLVNKIRETDYLNEYDFLFFIDDDAYLNVNYLNYLLPYFDKSKFYGLIMGGYPNNPTLPFPSGGSGYIISPSLFKNFTPIYRPVYTSGGSEDVVVGNWLKENDQRISQSVFIGDKEHRFELNGWWPFHREKNRLEEQEGFQQDYHKIVIERYVNDETRTFINKHLTHHYIRYDYEMQYIHSILKDWIPGYL